MEQRPLPLSLSHAIIFFGCKKKCFYLEPRHHDHDDNKKTLTKQEKSELFKVRGRYCAHTHSWKVITKLEKYIY